MDDDTVEVDELQDDVVVLAIPALHLLIFGRTVDKAMARARSSIAFRLLQTGRPTDQPAAVALADADAASLPTSCAA
jgi:hypothetical protein